MVVIRLLGDKHGDKFVWKIDVADSRGAGHEADGTSDTEAEAKEKIMALLKTLVDKLEFSPSQHRRDLLDEADLS